MYSIYKTYKTKSGIISCLKVRSIYDVLKYEFDEPKSIIIFSSDLPDGYVSLDYYIDINETDNGTIIKLIQQNHFFSGSRFPLYFNEFFYKKIEAEPTNFEN